MIVCYPLTTQLDYTELRYSLRSIEKFLKKPFEVVVVGVMVPDWINNVTQIEIPDVPGRSLLSVRRKVIAALHYTDEIFFMNDDFYLLKKTNPHHFPYYYSGSLEKKSEAGARPLLTQLQSINKPFAYYGHYPAVYKKDFTQVMQNFTEDCITKSAYCNFIEPNAVEVADCKIMTTVKPGYVKEFIKDKPSFSTGVQSINSVLPVLEELFPEPSKYEI